MGCVTGTGLWEFSFGVPAQSCFRVVDLGAGPMVLVVTGPAWTSATRRVPATAGEGCGSGSTDVSTAVATTDTAAAVIMGGAIAGRPEGSRGGGGGVENKSETAAATLSLVSAAVERAAKKDAFAPPQCLRVRHFGWPTAVSCPSLRPYPR